MKWITRERPMIARCIDTHGMTDPVLHKLALIVCGRLSGCK
jgi:hypothetical protein